MSTAMAYTYKPLRVASTIRLIKILPDKVNDKVVCLLHYFDQAEAPPYRALSYVWGDPTPAGHVYLGEHPDQVYLHALHENFLEFLRCMWEQKKFDTLFWTDSLCLNQKDNSEKSQQVPRMADIYANADEVICWLGHELEKEQQMRLIQEWPLREWSKLDTGFDDNHQHAAAVKQNKGLELLEASATGRLVAQAAESLLLLPYWTRVWVVQEVVLARKAVLTCGRAFHDIDIFRKKINGLQRRLRNRSTIFAICELRDRKGKMPLLQLLQEFDIVDSSLRVDKVYGFLGLVDPSREKTAIEVNYEKTASEVFWDAMFECDVSWKLHFDIFYGMSVMVMEQEKKDAGTKAKWVVDQQAHGIRSRNKLDERTVDLRSYIKSRWTSNRHAILAEIALRVSETARSYLRKAVLEKSVWLATVHRAFLKTERPVGPHLELKNAALLGLVFSVWLPEAISPTSHWSNEATLDPSWECEVVQLEDENLEPVIMSGVASSSNVEVTLTTPVPETISQSYLTRTGRSINFKIKGKSFRLGAALHTECGPGKSWEISFDFTTIPPEIEKSMIERNKKREKLQLKIGSGRQQLMHPS